MNWAWASALDQMWRSPAFPMWLTLAAAGFFAFIAVITLVRAEKSVANGALTVITLLAVGVALAATMRSFGTVNSEKARERALAPSMTASAPALACLDDLAGEAVLAACEKAVFGSPESTAAALSYAAHQIDRLTTYGDVATANKTMTGDLEALRHAVEHDRYGLIAQVLWTRDHCTASSCALFRSLTDTRRIAANIDAGTYDASVARYAVVWSAPPVAPAPAVAAQIPGVPTGKPTNAEFPSASSTPPVSIMTAEPPTASARAAATPAAANSQAAKPAPTASPAVAAAKKQAAPKPARTPAPAAAAAPTSLVPAASND